MFMVTFAFIWQVFLLTESYLHSFFSFNISLQFLLVTFLKGFLFNYSGEFFSLFLKVPVNLAQYRVTMGIFQPIYFKFTLLGVFIFGYVKRSVQLWFQLFFINILLFSAFYFYQRVMFWKSQRTSAFRIFCSPTWLRTSWYVFATFY